MLKGVLLSMGRRISMKRRLSSQCIPITQYDLDEYKRIVGACVSKYPLLDLGYLAAPSYGAGVLPLQEYRLVCKGLLTVVDQRLVKDEIIDKIQGIIRHMESKSGMSARFAANGA